jgi:hypothetical protein
MKLTIKNYTKLEGTRYGFKNYIWTCSKVDEDNLMYVFNLERTDVATDQKIYFPLYLERKAWGKNFENKWAYKFTATNKVLFTADELWSKPTHIIQLILSIN